MFGRMYELLFVLILTLVAKCYLGSIYCILIAVVPRLLNLHLIIRNWEYVYDIHVYGAMIQ